jgi:uncharacterized protein YcnI
MSSRSAPFRRARRLAAVTALSLGLVGLTTVAADAHVRLNADDPTAGSFSQLTFRVPNESDSAGTIKLAVQLPQDTPFAFVSVKPVPGWKIAVEEAKLPTPITAEGTTITKAARTITWTAEKGNQVAPDEYQEFSISAGPLPEVAELAIPAVQTYSDGQVVNWNEPTPASGDEPEHPAPTVQIMPASTAGAASPEPSAATAPTTSTAPASNARNGSDTTARWLAGIALLVGIAGAALGALGLRRGTR